MQVICSPPIKAARHAVADTKSDPGRVDVNDLTRRVDHGDLMIEGIQDGFEKRLPFRLNNASQALNSFNRRNRLATARHRMHELRSPQRQDLLCARRGADHRARASWVCATVKVNGSFRENLRPAKRKTASGLRLSRARNSPRAARRTEGVEPGRVGSFAAHASERLFKSNRPIHSKRGLTSLPNWPRICWRQHGGAMMNKANPQPA